MSDQLQMFGPMTSEDMSSVTGSPELQSGPTRSDSQDGQTAAQCGQAPAPARLSARQAKAKGLMTLATSGRIGLDSSASATLQSALENRLMMRLDTAGSTLFKLTWKARRTPLGRRYLERAVSVLRTSDRGCTSVPTPCAQEDNKSIEAHLAMKHRMGERDGTGANRTAITSLQVVAKLSAVPSPCTPSGGRSCSTNLMDATGRMVDGRKHTASLEHTVKFASVPTASARDWRDGRASQKTIDRNARPLNEQIVNLATVATPRSEDSRGSPDSLHSQAQLADSGQTATGGMAKTESIGQLNAGYSRWLMGLPPVFCDCAVTAMASWRKSRRSS